MVLDSIKSSDPVEKLLAVMGGDYLSSA